MNTALELGFSPTVYSLFYEETQEVIDRISKDYPHEMYTEAWTKKQDPMHDAFLETWQNWARPSLPNINWSNEFPHSYPGNGSSEPIRESLAQHAADVRLQGLVPRIHVFDGEYEGYEAVASGYHIEVIKHSRFTWKSNDYGFRAGDCFYLSHPSSLDGNIWEDADEFIRYMALNHRDVKLRLDLCYLGTTTRDFVLKNAGLFNVDMIFFSLSKVFGVYYHRIGGVFSKKALPGLFGNKWFKNLFSLRLGTALLREFDPRDLPEKYKPLQTEAFEFLKSKTGTDLGAELRASDVVLLASCYYHHTYVAQVDLASWEYPLVRGDCIRYCLTPYMGRKLGR